MMQRKNERGSVLLNRKTQTWRLFVYDAAGKRQSRTIGTRHDLPTKTAARQAAQPLITEMLQPTAAPLASPPAVLTVTALVGHYRKERMPTRYSTRRSYDVWLNRYVLPRWGAQPIAALQAQPVELWLQSLPLAARSKSEIRALMGRLLACGMWRGDIQVQLNPMTLVRVPGASKRTRKPRSLTVAEFQKMLAELSEPFRTIALVCACFGLRISECLGLQWGDVNWLDAKLSIQRGVVRNRIGDCKTVGSEQSLFISPEMLAVLKTWRQRTQFASESDWVFASTSRLGRQPLSADSVGDAYKKAATAAEIAHVSTHSMRHSFRSWLDAVGSSVATQQQLMRHRDVRTTMNVYGRVVTDAMSVAAGKVARLAVPGLDSETNSTPQQHTADVTH
jgi:integrase